MEEEKAKLMEVGGEHGDPPVRSEAGMRCCVACCGCCMAPFVLWATVVMLLSLLAAVMSAPSVCAVEEVDPAQALAGGVVMGTGSNVIGPKWPRDEVDLTGLWWLRWKVADGPLVALYSSFRIEIMVTFADSTMDDGGVAREEFSPPLFPAVMKHPMAVSRHWGYSTSYAATHLMFSHSRYLDPADPDARLTYTFANATYADIHSIGIDFEYPFSNIGADEWLRPNLEGKLNYVLTRVAYGNGTPHPVNWPLFLQFMDGFKLRVWADDSVCRRKCESLLLALLVPHQASCTLCARVC